MMVERCGAAIGRSAVRWHLQPAEEAGMSGKLSVVDGGAISSSWVDCMGGQDVRSAAEEEEEEGGSDEGH